MFMCHIPNAFRDRAMEVIARIKERQNALRRATRQVVTGISKFINIYGGIFENVLY
jgi:hypothetical protein